jgi:hypothetical protein
MNKHIKPFVLWGLYALYLYFMYHLVVTPALLEFSYYGLLGLLVLLGLVIWLCPPGWRKELFTFTLLFLLLAKSFGSMERVNGIAWTIFSYIIVLAIAFLIARLYGKLSYSSIVSMLLVAILLHSMFTRSELPVLSHFTEKWASRSVYAGEKADSFPMLVRDINNDGKAEIITLGNAEEEQAKTDALLDKGMSENEIIKMRSQKRQLETEPLHLYVYTWNGKTMARIPEAKLNKAELMAMIPNEHIGFPYYYLNKQAELVPLVQRQQLAESMLQFGTAPFRALTMDITNLAKQLEQSGNVMDRKDTFRPGSSFSNVAISDGAVKGNFNGRPFAMQTNATKIVDTLRLPGKKEGLVLIGEDLAVVTVDNQGRGSVAYRLSRDMIQQMVNTTFLVADVDKDQTDEILISSPYSRIIKPAADGKWSVLWTARDKTFRFQDYNKVGNGQGQELLTLDKSLIRDNLVRYVSSYQYSDQGLQRNWKIFMSLINIQAADIDGDGKNELIASIDKRHRILVLEQHHIPVVAILCGITALLIISLAVRRVRTRHV